MMRDLFRYIFCGEKDIRNKDNLSKELEKDKLWRKPGSHSMKPLGDGRIAMPTV
jgi:hypothetical protein